MKKVVTATKKRNMNPSKKLVAPEIAKLSISPMLKDEGLSVLPGRPREARRADMSARRMLSSFWYWGRSETRELNDIAVRKTPPSRMRHATMVMTSTAEKLESPFVFSQFTAGRASMLRMMAIRMRLTR